MRCSARSVGRPTAWGGRGPARERAGHPGHLPARHPGRGQVLSQAAHGLESVPGSWSPTRWPATARPDAGCCARSSTAARGIGTTGRKTPTSPPGSETRHEEVHLGWARATILVRVQCDLATFSATASPAPRRCLPPRKGRPLQHLERTHRASHARLNHPRPDRLSHLNQPKAISSARPTEQVDDALIINRRHLTAVLAEYVAHYNHHRPHRALHQAAPFKSLPPPASPSQLHLRRRDLIGGLIHDYTQLA
jgi:Integrase core domain